MPAGHQIAACSRGRVWFLKARRHSGQPATAASCQHSNILGFSCLLTLKLESLEHQIPERSAAEAAACKLVLEAALEADCATKQENIKPDISQT